MEQGFKKYETAFMILKAPFLEENNPILYIAILTREDINGIEILKFPFKWLSWIFFILW